MHKKLFTAVLALGLLLLGAVTVFATAIDDERSDRPVATLGNGQSNRPTPVPVSSGDPVVTLNGGVNRTVPGTFCDGEWQGGYTGYFFGGWFEGYEASVNAVYQDPNTLGSCAPGSRYTFDVTAVNAILVSSAPTGATAARVQPMIWDADLTNPACPVPGPVLHVGPVYLFNLSAAGAYLLPMAFAIEACVTGPYFAGYVVSDPSNTIDYGTLGPGLDYTSGAPVTPCYQFSNDFYGSLSESGWYTPTSLANLELWSEGYTPDDLATHCNPGMCGCQHFYEGIDAAVFGAGGCESFGGSPGACRNDCWSRVFPLPTAEGTGVRQKAGVAFSAFGLDTLKSVGIRLTKSAGFCPLSAGVEDTAALILEVWDQSGPPDPCGNPTPGLLLYSTPVPKSDVVYDPFVTEVTLPDITFGTLNGGPVEYIFVTVTFDPVNSTQPNDCVVMTSGDPENTGCAATTRSIELVTVAPGGPWFWMNSRPGGGGVRELWIDAEICSEVLPAIEADCGAGGPDEWSQFAHDAQQTSASSINVGDPNGVKLSWTQPLTGLSNFTNPTVANDIVYTSSDLRLSAHSLTTGALLGTVFGFPEMGGENRGNTTVAFVRGLPSGPDRDVVLATGGTSFAISAWETTLGPPLWSINAVTAPVTAGLTNKNRFNTCKVVDIAGTDVLFVLTEPSTGPGLLWAINAGSGALYPGWATNPVILDAAGKHGPAISGGKLYVGTAIGGSNVSGSLYQINAADGVIDWNFVGVAGEGWPSGVSTEGNYLYGATRDAAGVGRRYKIDKSLALPSVVWTAEQGTGLYGTPTIGRKFVYFPLSNVNIGLLQVDKDLGLVTRNFVTSDICGASLSQVPQIATLSCDAYIFAGDNNARWWLFNAVTGAAEWYRQFPVPGTGIVNGTALATAASGDSYAVVGIRTTGAGGTVSAYKLNTGARPRLIQCVEDVTIEVPFGTLAGNPHSEPDALLNLGNLPLNITVATVSDPVPDGLASNARKARAHAASVAQTAKRYMNAEGYYDVQGHEKQLRMAGLLGGAAGEELPGDAAFLSPDASTSVRNSNRMAASAAAIRTGNVRINGIAPPTSIAPGVSASLDWDFDGSGLLRGIDLNVIELTNNDPDFDYDAVNNGSISVAEVNVLYVGGCAQDQTWISWNLDGANANAAKVFNHGTFCDQGADAMIIGDDPTSAGDDQRWEGGVLLAGDSSAAIGGAQLAIDYYFFEEYVPNPNPAGDCGFEKDSGLVLGAKRTGGCPGTPTAIHGAYVKTYYADSNLNVAGNSPLAAMGINVEETEVGADDPLYGDFILTRMVFINRNATAKTVRAGTYFDWDINTDASNNVGYISDGFNGYAIWDPTVTHFAYGALDVNQPSSYGGVDPTAFPPAMIMCNLNDTTYGGLGNADWVGNHYPDDWQYGWWLASGKYAGPRHTMGGNGVAGMAADRGGFLVNSLNLAGNGSGEIVQAQFAFNIAGNSNDAFVEASGQGIAKRAARWAGFARGDVNDDGVVDLADVCWIQGGNPLYPDAYCGDVDASGNNDATDIARLLSYVSGNAASRPAGAWRFPW